MSGRVRRSSAEIGANLASWRKLLRLTSQQVAERAGISRSTLSRLENGDPGVSVGVFLSVARAVGVLERVAESTDPYETDFGRARLDQVLPERVRR